MQLGQRIDRFDIMDTLGQGGIATVYQVRHAQLETVHALKILKVGHAPLAQRLLQEGRIQARLSHPNVVSVTDVIEQDGNIGLLMEFVEGFSLEDCLSEGPMSVDEALSIFRQVLSGVGAAHALGVTHRDLKPANILLTADNDRVVAKITDFGIAKVFSEGESPTATRAGITMGTPGYMAPEQMSDSASVDHRADIFALGVILYEMLAGVGPFVGQDTMDTLNRTAQGRCVPLPVQMPGLPEQIYATVEMALAPDRARRLPDCQAFAQFLLGEDLDIPPALSPLPVTTRPKRPRTSAPTLAPVDLDLDLDLDQAHDGADGPTDLGAALPTFSGHLEGGLGESDTLASEFVEEDLEDDPTAPTDTGGRQARSELSTLLAKAMPYEIGCFDLGEEEDDQDEEVETPSEGMNIPEAIAWLSEFAMSMFQATLWGMLKAMQYGGIPLLIVVGGTYAISQQAAVKINAVHEELQAQEIQTKRSMDATSGMVPALARAGGDSSLLQASLGRYEASNTIDGKIAAGRELSSVMGRQLASLPPPTTDSEHETRRRIELALTRVDDQMAAYESLAERRDDLAGSNGGRLASTFGMLR